MRPVYRRDHRPGNVVAIVSLVIAFLTGMIAFALDIGYIALARTEIQRGADSAALAGTSLLARTAGRWTPPPSGPRSAGTSN